MQSDVPSMTVRDDEEEGIGILHLVVQFFHQLLRALHAAHRVSARPANSSKCHRRAEPLFKRYSQKRALLSPRRVFREGAMDERDNVAHTSSSETVILTSVRPKTKACNSERQAVRFGNSFDPARDRSSAPPRAERDDTRGGTHSSNRRCRTLLPWRRINRSASMPIWMWRST